MTTDRRSRLVALEADVDARLAALWALLWESHVDEAMSDDDELRRQIAGAVRVAYTQGYQDALIEVREGRHAELHRTHGCRLP